jgi:hypothetical protein
MLASLRSLAASTLAASLALATPVQAASPDDGVAYHIFQTPEQMAQSGRTPSQGAKGDMLYFGGTVFTKMKVVSVIWGPHVNSQTVADISGFLKAIVNSTYVDQLNIYDTDLKGVNGRKGTNQKIQRGKYLGQIQITPEHKGLTLSDKDIRAELTYQISKGVLPANTLNTLYMTYFPADITIKLDGLTSCQQFGAYHEAVSSKRTPLNVFYGVMPDCGAGFDFLTIVSSHEFAEATTDNIPTPGTHPKYPQAWNTSDGYEIGDLCEGTEATLTTKSTVYEVQELYLNNIQACGTANSLAFLPRRVRNTIRDIAKRAVLNQSPDEIGKSFLLLFLKKEVLPSYRNGRARTWSQKMLFPTVNLRSSIIVKPWRW